MRPPMERHPFSGYGWLLALSVLITLTVILAGTAVKA